MIRSLDIPTCQGCWDEDVVFGLNACECSYPSQLAEKRGRLAHEWTQRVLHPELKEYLAQLPLAIREDNLCFVYGSPNSQHEYLLPTMDGFAAAERVLASGTAVLFCGHTHVPYVRTLEKGTIRVKVKGQGGYPFNRPAAQFPFASSEGSPICSRMENVLAIASIHLWARFTTCAPLLGYKRH